MVSGIKKPLKLKKLSVKMLLANCPINPSIESLIVQTEKILDKEMVTPKEPYLPTTNTATEAAIKINEFQNKLAIQNKELEIKTISEIKKLHVGVGGAATITSGNFANMKFTTMPLALPHQPNAFLRLVNRCGFTKYIQIPYNNIDKYAHVHIVPICSFPVEVQDFHSFTTLATETIRFEYTHSAEIHEYTTISIEKDGNFFESPILTPLSPGDIIITMEEVTEKKCVEIKQPEKPAMRKIILE